MLWFLSSLALASGWTTAGFDVRRTGQSDVQGPTRVSSVRTLKLPEEQVINIPALVADDGSVVTGSWGVIRSFGETDRTLWDKFDGSLFRLTPSLSNIEWENPLDRVPYCYNYDNRVDAAYCPGGGAVSYYNGTVEGTATLSADGKTLYVGRGDGKLYAVSLATGATLWRFKTFNPEDPSDPDGGGEVVGGPAVGADGTIYFATVGVGDHETNAVYAVDPSGNLVWRYPDATASAPHAFWAAPAISPHGTTLYVAGTFSVQEGPKVDQPGVVLAFDIAPATSGTGDARLAWSFNPINSGEWWTPVVWPFSLSVGIDGTLYLGGTMWTAGGGSAVVFALNDTGTTATYAWQRMADVDRNEGRVVYGLGLREKNSLTERVIATSGNTYSPLSASYGNGGSIVSLEAWDGSLLAEYDPQDAGLSGSLNGVAIDVDGRVYTVISGTTDKGHVLALDEDLKLLWQYQTGGLLEWAHPVLGPGGGLFVADSRRCALAGAGPIEDGLCARTNMDPTVYRIIGQDRPDPDPEDTDQPALVDTDSDLPERSETKPPAGGCGCDAGASSWSAWRLIARR